jgi:nucleotide-binding universal stress UspA family protein
MLNVRKILCPVDTFPCKGQALEHALRLAERYGAELHMLHAIITFPNDTQYPGMPSTYFEDMSQYLEDQARMEMKSAIGSRENIGVDVVMDGIRGISAADVILDYAGENDVDLIVMGTHGRHGLGHLFLGSVAEEVVRSAKCPVLTLREMKQSLDATNIERILVPVDYSEHSKVALKYARELAEANKAKLQLLHIIEEPVYPDFYGPGDDPHRVPKDYIKQRAVREMNQLCDESLCPEIETEIHILSGRAALEIVKFAEENWSDLIVIASHGLTGIKHLLLGSVAEKIVRMAPCPVFTVKAFGKSLTTDSWGGSRDDDSFDPGDRKKAHACVQAAGRFEQ